MSEYFLTDDQLDQRLREVVLPTGLVGRLQQTVQRSDVELDNALAEVPLPPGLITRLAGIASRKARGPSQRLALAASLFLAVGLSYASAWLIFISAGYRVAQRDLPSSLDARMQGDGMQFTGVADARLHDAEQFVQDSLPQPVDAEEARFEVDLAVVEPATPTPVFPSPFPGVEGSRRSAGQVELGLDAFGSDVLGASPNNDGGGEVQSQRRDSRRFSAFTGENRYASAPTLTTSRDSYLAARRMLNSGIAPPPESIRPQEFLTSVNYGFAKPTPDLVTLNVAGGPSPFSGGGQLLLVGVQAPDLPKAKRDPTHLIVCVDTTPSMQNGVRLLQAKVALKQLASTLTGKDRLSLVAVDAAPRVIIEDAGPEHIEDVKLAIESLGSNSQAGYDPVAALRLAYGMTAEYLRPSMNHRIVLLSDGLIKVTGLSTKPLADFLRGSAGRPATLSIVDLANLAAPPAHWLEVADATEGKLVQAETSDQIRWTLLEALTGQSQKVAASARLSVAFDPKAVVKYRLFGQEALANDASEVTIDLFAGQTSVVLYEIQLLPKGTDPVARISLAWRDPATKKPKTPVTHNVKRANFAKQFAAESPSLQFATLAAGLARVLNHEEGPTAGDLQELAGQASKLQAKPAFKELVELLQMAERARRVP